MNIKKNFLLNSIYQCLAIVIPIILTPYLTRHIGSSGMGIYSFHYSIAYYFIMFAMLGFSLYGNRSVASVNYDRHIYSKVFWEIYGLQIISSSVAILAYIVFTSNFFPNERNAWVMLLMVVSCTFDINWFYFGIEKFNVAVTRNIYIKLLTAILTVLLVKKEQDVVIYALVIGGSTLFSNLLLVIQLPKYIDWVKIDISDIKKHLVPCLTLFFPTIIVSIYKVVDKIMLGIMSNVSEVGFYESSERIINLPMAFITALGTVMLPRVSSMLGRGQTTDCATIFEKSIKFVMFLSSAISMGIIAVSEEFIPMFLGEDFRKCILIVDILMPSCLFLAFANVIRTQYLIPHKKDRSYIISLLIGAVVNLILNMLLIPKYQAIGAAIGTLVAEMAVCFYQTWSVRYNIDIKKNIKNVCSYLIAGLIMCLGCFGIKRFTDLNDWLFLFYKVVIGVVIYFSVLAVSWVVKIYVKK